MAKPTLGPGGGRAQGQSYPLSPPPRRRAGAKAVLPHLSSAPEEGGGKGSPTSLPSAPEEGGGMGSPSPSPLHPGGGREQRQSYPLSPPSRRRAGTRAVLPPLPSVPEEGGDKGSPTPSSLRPFFEDTCQRFSYSFDI